MLTCFLGFFFSMYIVHQKGTCYYSWLPHTLYYPFFTTTSIISVQWPYSFIHVYYYQCCQNNHPPKRAMFLKIAMRINTIDVTHDNYCWLSNITSEWTMEAIVTRLWKCNARNVHMRLFFSYPPSDWLKNDKRIPIDQLANSSHGTTLQGRDRISLSELCN